MSILLIVSLGELVAGLSIVAAVGAIMGVLATESGRVELAGAWTRWRIGGYRMGDLFRV